MQRCVGEFLHLCPIKMDHHHKDKWSSGGVPWFFTLLVIAHDGVSLNSWAEQDGLCTTRAKGVKTLSACICAHKRVTQNSKITQLVILSHFPHHNRYNFHLASLLTVIAAIVADFCCKFKSGSTLPGIPLSLKLLIKISTTAFILGFLSSPSFFLMT